VLSVSSVSAGWSDSGQFVEINIGDDLESFGGWGALEGIGQRLGPGGVFGLERDQLGHGVMPSLWPGAPIGRSPIANRWRGGLCFDAGSVTRLPFGTAERGFALWWSASWHSFFSVT
jgi:hypothetical protein